MKSKQARFWEATGQTSCTLVLSSDILTARFRIFTEVKI